MFKFDKMQRRRENSGHNRPTQPRETPSPPKKGIKSLRVWKDYQN